MDQNAKIRGDVSAYIELARSDLLEAHDAPTMQNARYRLADALDNLDKASTLLNGSVIQAAE